jgi:hypothetical protein
MLGGGRRATGEERRGEERRVEGRKRTSEAAATENDAI